MSRFNEPMVILLTAPERPTPMLIGRHWQRLSDEDRRLVAEAVLMGLVAVNGATATEGAVVTFEYVIDPDIFNDWFSYHKGIGVHAGGILP